MSNSDFFSLFASDHDQNIDTLAAELELSLDTINEGFPNDSESFESMFERMELEEAELEHPYEEISGFGEPQTPAISLVPPLWQEYQALQRTVADLTLALADAEQKLSSHDDQTDSRDGLMVPQGDEFHKTQDQLSHTVAELKIYQEDAQRQQWQVETLAEQIDSHQRQIAQLEQDYAHKRQEVVSLEKQMQDLQTRLQRQQHYTLQYKSALEQCLAQPNFQPSSDIAPAIAALTGKGKLSEIRPWTSPVPKTPEPVLASASLTPVEPRILETTVIVTDLPITDESVTPPVVEIEPALPLRPQGKRPSFSIHSAKTSRRSIDLPRFLPNLRQG